MTTGFWGLPILRWRLAKLTSVHSFISRTEKQLSHNHVVERSSNPRLNLLEYLFTATSFFSFSQQWLYSSGQDLFENEFGQTALSSCAAWSLILNLAWPRKPSPNRFGKGFGTFWFTGCLHSIGLKFFWWITCVTRDLKPSRDLFSWLCSLSSPCLSVAKKFRSTYPVFKASYAIHMARERKLVKVDDFLISIL